MAECVLYVYKLTYDNGFAPCVENGMLSLVCCKSRMRRAIQKRYSDAGRRRKKSKRRKRNEKNTATAKKQIYILGVCGTTLKPHKGFKGDAENTKLTAVYLAKVDEVLSMKEYYKRGPKGYRNRADGRAYVTKGNKLVACSGNPHKNCAEDMKRDRNGLYAILSRDFIYWGDKVDRVNLSNIAAACGNIADCAFLNTVVGTGGGCTVRDYTYKENFVSIDDVKNACTFKDGHAQVLSKVPLSERFNAGCATCSERVRGCSDVLVRVGCGSKRKRRYVVRRCLRRYEGC
jgi:hypothetical protein